ncbi:Bifunctional dehydrogenase and ferrochelatase, partial [Spiromyces aspiralis]
MSSNASPQPQPAYPDPTGGASFIIAWRAKRQSILVVGGGPVAAGRVFNSLEADADVTVVAPHLCPELQYRARTCQISWHARKFIPSDLDGVAIVLTAIDDCEESVRIAQLCRERRIPINAADMNDLCDFWFMSMHRDKSVQVA